MLDENASYQRFGTAGIVQIDYDVETMQGQFIRMMSPLELC